MVNPTAIKTCQKPRPRFLASFYRCRINHVGGGSKSRKGSGFITIGEDFCKGCSNTRIWTNKNHKASYSSNAYSSFNRHISCQFCKCNFDRKWTELFGDWHSTPCTELGGDGKRSFQVFAIGKTLFDIIARTGQSWQ